MNDLDLNLLRTLDVLLRERSVTAAAARLGRSQPAVSHALGRLRQALGDPLLVREGRGLVPTPRALALAPAIERILRDVERVLRESGAFEPATSRRTFVLGAPDMLAPLVSDLLAGLEEAPNVVVELRSAGVDEADISLGALPDEAPGVMARPLGVVRQAVALRRGHPALSGPWTPERYVAWPHVTVRTGNPGPSLVERALSGAGLERRVGLVVPTLLLAPHVVARSDLLFTGPRELLERLPLDLVLLPPPVLMPEVRVAAMWAERLDGDAGHRWFRRRVIDVIAGQLQMPPAEVTIR